MFWDSSALVPMLIDEPHSGALVDAFDAESYTGDLVGHAARVSCGGGARGPRKARLSRGGYRGRGTPARGARANARACSHGAGADPSHASALDPCPANRRRPAVSSGAGVVRGRAFRGHVRVPGSAVTRGRAARRVCLVAPQSLSLVSRDIEWQARRLAVRH